MLLQVGHVPKFGVWLVGGSDGEVDLIEELIVSRPSLCDLRTSGALTVWGRVETAALPELYSRSSVVVVPSSREQFGIVAIEAMSCGTPVIATRVGGLADIVLRSYTGTKLASDDSGLLANAMLGYLRNPDRVRREGANAARWARLAFANSSVYEHYNVIYEGTGRPTNFPSRDLLRRDDIAQVKHGVELYLDSTITLSDVSSSDHTSAIIEGEKQRYFCKWYRPEQANNLTVIPVPPVLRLERTLGYYIGRLRFHDGNPLVPRLVRPPDPAWPFALFEACEAVKTVDTVQLKRITDGFRAYRPINPDDPDGDRYVNALTTAITSPTLDSIRQHDIAAALLNQRLSCDGPRFHQVHPHIELLRVNFLLEDAAWALPREVKERFSGAMAYVLDRAHVPREMPKLCHGSLKPAHFLTASSGDVVVCDLDGSRYAVGPVDEVHHVLSDVASNESLALAATLSRLARLSSSREELTVAASWLLVFLIYEALLIATTGGDIRKARAIRVCHDLPYAWRRIVTPSR